MPRLRWGEIKKLKLFYLLSLFTHYYFILCCVRKIEYY